MNYCRNCDHWKEQGQWFGICTKDYFTKPLASESAIPRIFGCTKYKQFKKDKYYQGKHIVVPKKEANATIRTS